MTRETIIEYIEQGIVLNVSMDDETVWLTQEQLAILFNQSKQNISLHVNNLFKEGELVKNRTVKDSLTVQDEGDRRVTRSVRYYNLDVIISVGYRVKSKRGTNFRIWATKILKEHLVKKLQANTLETGQKYKYLDRLEDLLEVCLRVRGMV